MKFSESDLTSALAANPDLQLVGEAAPSPRRMAARQTAPDALSESQMQQAVIAECDRRAQEDPRWGYLLAIPNGGHRHPAVAGKMKSEGVRAGVPDLLLPVPNPSKGFSGLFVELKVGRNQLTPKQQAWGDTLRQQGYCVVVVRDDPQKALDVIAWYLESA